MDGSETGEWLFAVFELAFLQSKRDRYGRLVQGNILSRLIVNL